MDAIPPADPTEIVVSAGGTFGSETLIHHNGDYSEAPFTLQGGFVTGADMNIGFGARGDVLRLGAALKYRYAGYHMPMSLLYLWPRWGSRVKHGPRVSGGIGWSWGPDYYRKYSLSDYDTHFVGDVGYYMTDRDNGLHLGFSFFTSIGDNGHASQLYSLMATIGYALFR